MSMSSIERLLRNLSGLAFLTLLTAIGVTSRSLGDEYFDFRSTLPGDRRANDRALVSSHQSTDIELFKNTFAGEFVPYPPTASVNKKPEVSVSQEFLELVTIAEGRIPGRIRSEEIEVASEEPKSKATEEAVRPLPPTFR